MQDRNWGEHHLRWHAERQWDRRSPAAQAQMTAAGWARAAVQEGEPGNGREFLLMHRAMIHILLSEFPGNAAWFVGWTTPPTDPNDAGDPVPANSPLPGAFSPQMIQAIDRLTNNLAGFVSEDELGLFIETRFRPIPGSPFNVSPDPSSGIHNYLHGRFTDNDSPINLGDPSVNLDNARFWRLHGWIDDRWSAYRQLKGLADTDPAYLADLETEKDAMLGAHVHPHAASPAAMAAARAVRRATIEALPAEVHRPFVESTAHRVQRLVSTKPTIADRDELIEYLQTAVQVEHATLPLYLTAMWSLRDSGGEHYAILRSVSMQEMLHFGIVCNLLKAIGEDPDIIPPEATLPLFPGQLPGLDVSDVQPGDISLEALTSGAGDKTRIRLFMRVEEPQAGDIDPALAAAVAAVVPKFHSIGEFYDVIIKGLQDLSATGEVVFAPYDHVAVFAEMTEITSLAEAIAQLELIKEQGEGTTTSQASGSGPEELAHYYRFKQIEVEHKYNWDTGNPVLDPALTLPFPGVADVRQFVPAPLGGHPESAAFDESYSRMLDALHDAWHGSPDAVWGALSVMYDMSTRAIELMDSGYGPNFHYVAAPPVAPAAAVSRAVVHAPGIRRARPLAVVHAAPVALAAVAVPGYARIRDILDTSVNGETFGAHGPFWRSLTRDQFVAKTIFGRKLIHTNADGTFNPDESNLVKALEGRAPFGKDLVPPPPGAMWNRMPDGYPPVPQAQIDEIRAWIGAGCPDVNPAAAGVIDVTSPAALTDDDYVLFWRVFDNVAMYEATPQVQADIGDFFNIADKWFAFAASAAAEPAWDGAIHDAAVAAAIRRLEDLQRQTVQSTFGVPSRLADLLACWERFGDDSLPDDPLRPDDVRHTMNGESMWFFWAAFADAASRFSATDAAIPADFWEALSRAVLIGVLNDGVFRGRFPVVGFDATAAGKEAIRAHVASLTPAQLSLDLRTRFVEGGFGI